MRLGKSGLKISKIILGCMSYGSPEWQEWVLGEEEGLKHIKFAYVGHQALPWTKWLILWYRNSRYDHGITTFDTANVSTCSS